MGVVGFLARDLISGALRSLWVVAFALILWSAVIWVAEQRHDVLEKRGIQRGEHDITVMDGLVIGLVQCFSLIPGVSRSGATISAGLMRGHQPGHRHRAVLLHGDPGAHRGRGVRGGPRQGRPGRARAGPDAASAIVVAFGTAYASIAWLLRFVATNSLRPFIWYRVALGLARHRGPRRGLDHRHLTGARGRVAGQLQPAAALEGAVQRSADQRHQARPRRSSRTGTRHRRRGRWRSARACSRSSCRRCRRSSSGTAAMATQAEMRRMSVFCCTVTCARWAPSTSVSSRSYDSTWSMTACRWSDTSRKLQAQLGVGRRAGCRPRAAP